MGKPNDEKVDANGKADQKAAHSVEQILMDQTGGVNEKPQQQSDRQTKVSDYQHAPGPGVKLPSLNPHRYVPPL
jgi:hypothetical protein